MKTTRFKVTLCAPLSLAVQKTKKQQSGHQMQHQTGILNICIRLFNFFCPSEHFIHVNAALSLSLSAANICGPKRQQWKVFQVWVCLLLAGVINSGGALVRDLSTQIWITRQRNLARSNLCVWYLHESKRECETSAANNRNSHVFLLFGCFAARLCAFVKQHFHEHRDERQQHKED